MPGICTAALGKHDPKQAFELIKAIHATVPQQQLIDEESAEGREMMRLAAAHRSELYRSGNIKRLPDEIIVDRRSLLVWRTPGKAGADRRSPLESYRMKKAEQQFFANLHRVLRPSMMSRVRAGKAVAKRTRDATIVAAFLALAYKQPPVPVRDRPAKVAAALGFTPRHVRAVVAAHRRKKSGTD